MKSEFQKDDYVWWENRDGQYCRGRVTHVYPRLEQVDVLRQDGRTERRIFADVTYLDKRTELIFEIAKRLKTADLQTLLDIMKRLTGNANRR